MLTYGNGDPVPGQIKGGELGLVECLILFNLPSFMPIDLIRLFVHSQ